MKPTNLFTRHLLAQRVRHFAGLLMFFSGMFCSPILLAAPACITPASDVALAMPGGIGGTGKMAEGGIGGTGMRAEGGIGGTGIIGTITGFASVCINGLEVHFDSATPVTQNGLPANTITLALGQVIAIDADNNERGLVARQISILNVLEGPATRVALDTNVLQVMGQTVQLTAATRWAGLAGLTDVQQGDGLRVAGYRDVQGAVHATRIEKVANMQSVSAIGLVAKGNLLHELPMLATLDKGVVDGEVLLRGLWDGKQLVAQAVLPDPALPFAGHANHIVMEGLVLDSKDPTHLRMAGFEVDLSGTTQRFGMPSQGFTPGQHIQVSGLLQGAHRISAYEIRPAALEHLMSPIQMNSGQMNQRGMSNMPQQMQRPAHPDRAMPMPLVNGMGGMRR